jgi:hypothetical protein
MVSSRAEFLRGTGTHDSRAQYAAAALLVPLHAVYQPLACSSHVTATVTIALHLGSLLTLNDPCCDPMLPLLLLLLLLCRSCNCCVPSRPPDRWQVSAAPQHRPGAQRLGQGPCL